MSEPIKTPISEAMLQTVIRGGQFVDPQQEWFGPQRPIEPSAPPEVAGRQFDYPSGYNINIRPRVNEPITFEQLRALADNLDILRLVIETRKDLVCKMRWEIKPKDKQRDKDARCEAVEAFLAIPDQEHTWAEWLRMLLEDLFVIDAPTIYPRMTKGGKLYALEPVDGATVVRKIDEGGRTPIPPDVAFQQYLKGVPAASFTRDQLIYKPRNLRTNRVYGFSPVEQIVMSVNIALRRQLSQLQFYTEGSTPDLILTVPPDWTTDQVRQFDAWWNETLSGNTAQRRKTKFVHGGVGSINTKDGLLKDEYDEWLARIITYAFSVPNQPFVKQMNRSTAETAQEQAINEGLVPIMNWVADLINFVVIKYFGFTDIGLEWVPDKDPNPVEDADIELKAAQRDQILLTAGIIDINEARVDRGMDELTPEEIEARKPAPPPQLIAPGQPQEPGSEPMPGEPAEPKEPAAKLAKKKESGQPIDRDRASVARKRTDLQRTIGAYLGKKGEEVAGDFAEAFDGWAGTAGELVADVTVSFADLVPEILDTLKAIAGDGVEAAAAQITLTDVDATKLAFGKAEAWATDRAAELVGMKWVDGELVTNPNAEWSITETTRDMIRGQVSQAIEEGWSNQQLATAIQDGTGFDDSRAEMIARTETAFADIQGNKATYEAARESGIGVKWQWVTAGDDLVSDECEMNDGEIRDIGDPFPSGATEPPQHPNCRCDCLPIVDDNAED